MDSVLRPRDIQARIRSGDSPEQVAVAAQTTVERIMGYATPVLAERAYVAEQAQKASVRRRAGAGPVGHLGEAVAERLAADGLDPDGVEWDSWRRDDGRWTVVADYAATDGGRRATFVYDVAGRYVVADDEASRQLVGERATPAGPATSPEQDAQTALGDDAIEVVTGRRPDAVEPQRPALAEEAEDLAGEATLDLSEAARAARSGVGAPDEWIATQASERPRRPAVVPPPPSDEGLFDADEVAPGDASVDDASGDDASGEGASVDEDPPAGGPADEGPSVTPAGEASPQGAPARQRAPRKPRSKGRASVPSWDEIMFGSGRGD